MEQVKKQMDEMGKKCTVYSKVASEPTVEQVDEVAGIAIENGCDAVMSIGGGSNIDVGKAVAALITNGTPAIDYMEYVGKGKKVTKEPVPFIAVPTTSGTGSEVTKNAVLGSSVQTFKRSMRSDMMIANLSIIDPVLSAGCPKKVTANSGIDAMTHLIEAYTTWRATPISDGLALKGIELAGKYLQRAYDDGSDMEAREGMAAASLMGGMAFANSGLGAAHGIGMAVGIAYHVPHGEACGILLPHVMKLNAPAVTERMARVGEALTGKRYASDKEAAQAAVDFVFALTKHMEIKPDFRHLNIPDEAIPGLAKASFGTSMSSNPVQLSQEEWEDYFRKNLM
jgi:alcohol dehydrogenase class IV